MNNFKDNAGQILKRARELAGLTQEAAAISVEGISVSGWIRIEHKGFCGNQSAVILKAWLRTLPDGVKSQLEDEGLVTFNSEGE